MSSLFLLLNLPDFYFWLAVLLRNRDFYSILRVGCGNSTQPERIRRPWLSRSLLRHPCRSIAVYKAKYLKIYVFSVMYLCAKNENR